jgi:hypothetical protein
MHSILVKRDCLVNIMKASRVLRVTRERATKTVQIFTLVSMTIGSETYSILMKRDCPVNIPHVSRTLKAAQEGNAENVQIAWLFGMAETYSILIKMTALSTSTMSPEC